MVEARRVNDRVMEVVLVFEEDVLRLICGYALQSGRSVKKNLCMIICKVSEICVV